MSSDAPSFGDSFTPPPSAFPPPPRAVRLRSIPWAGGCVVLFLAALGLGICPLTILPLTLSLFAKSAGESVPGVVTGKEKRGNRRSDYVVLFQFELDGLTHHAEVHVDPQTYSDTKIGEAIRVRALSFWPSKSASIEEPPIGTPPNVWSASCITLVLIGVSVLVAALLISRARARKHLARNGTPSHGMITAKRQMRGKGTTYRLVFEYSIETADGPAMREAEMDVTAKQFKSVSTGQAVTVLYDPERPERSMVYCFSEYQVLDM